jgi:hypothetical protein
MPRLAAAIGGAALLVATVLAAYAVDHLIGGPRGVLGGICVIGAVFGTCGFLYPERPRGQRLPRPARSEPARPARIPDPAIR